MVFFRRKNAPVSFKPANLSKPYAKHQRLGEGTYAAVYKVMDENGATFAMKEELINDAGDFQNESQLLTMLRHPAIVNLYEFGKYENRNVLILEYVGGGSLARVLSQLRQPLQESMIREYTRQILQALEYCHSFGVVHRDVKASNILVTESGKLKLADFGGSKRGNPAVLGEEALKASKPMQMTLLWAAPEQLRDHYTCKSDLWSLGCTVIEMVTLQRPWAEKEFTCNSALAYFLMNQNSGPPIPKYLSAEGQDFLQKCFIWDYMQRPTASELLQHKWFHPEGTLSLGSSTGSTAVGPEELPQGPGESPNLDPLTLSEYRVPEPAIKKLFWPSNTAETTPQETQPFMTDSTNYVPPKRITEAEMAAILEAEGYNRA